MGKTMTAYRFEVPGPPVGKARARVVGGHAYTPAPTKAKAADYNTILGGSRGK